MVLRSLQQCQTYSSLCQQFPLADAATLMKVTKWDLFLIAVRFSPPPLLNDRYVPSLIGVLITAIVIYLSPPSRDKPWPHGVIITLDRLQWRGGQSIAGQDEASASSRSQVGQQAIWKSDW